MAALGLAGQRWLAGLPELVSSLEADWTVTCGTALEGGNAAYVAEAVTARGSGFYRETARLSGSAPGQAGWRPCHRSFNGI